VALGEASAAITSDAAGAERQARHARAPVGRFVGPGYVVAFVAVTLAGVAQAMTTPGALAMPGGWRGLVLAGAAYALLGTLGLHAAERRGSRAGVVGVIAGLAAVGALATLASHGYASMLLLAVVSVGVLHLGAGASAALAVGAAAVAATAFALRDPLWSALLQAEVAFGSGMAFVFVFSRIARREHRARAERARAEERNRIAREIHDGLGHYLTVVHVQLEAARSTLASDPERASVALARAQQLTHEGLGEIRRSVGLLRGSTPVRPPLLEALGALVDDAIAAGMATRLRVEGSPRRLTEPIEFTLFRAAQEALTNARRHARASRVTITVEFTGTASVRLRVEDDGIGASDAASDAAGGFGLVGMRERAALIGGALAITTGPGQGFALELEVPA
jgi:signal transduction histidine kinase